MRESVGMPVLPPVRAAALLALAVLLCASCEGVGRDPGPQDDIGEAVEEPDESAAAGPETGVTLTELSRNPEEYYGRTVTVSATVGRVLEADAFSLVTDEPPKDEEPVEDEAVLVVGDNSASGLAEEQRVRVTGEVRRLNREEAGQELPVDLDDSVYVNYRGRPEIQATSVETLAGGGETTGG